MGSAKPKGITPESSTYKAEPKPVRGADLIGRTLYYRTWSLIGPAGTAAGTVIGVHDLEEDEITELEGVITTRRKHTIRLTMRNAEGGLVTRNLDECVPAPHKA